MVILKANTDTNLTYEVMVCTAHWGLIWQTHLTCFFRCKGKSMGSCAALDVSWGPWWRSTMNRSRTNRWSNPMADNAQVLRKFWRAHFKREKKLNLCNEWGSSSPSKGSTKERSDSCGSLAGCVGLDAWTMRFWFPMIHWWICISGLEIRESQQPPTWIQSTFCIFLLYCECIVYTFWS